MFATQPWEARELSGAKRAEGPGAAEVFTCREAAPICPPERALRRALMLAPGAVVARVDRADPEKVTWRN